MRRLLIAGILGQLFLPLSPGIQLEAQTPKLGTVAFPNSGARRAQPAFLRGVALLHSFEYEDAAEAFREAQRLDPGFALAYWGEALTYDHPLWGDHDSTAGRAVLARLAVTSEARIAKGRTPRERRYLEAVEALFASGDRDSCERAYEQVMDRLHREQPNDLEAATLHALALLATRPPSRDLRTSVRAAAIAEEVRRRNPYHPGATHYLIHAYDDPTLAPLGLKVARTYARIAPDAEHALHMPSHIFVQLGLWDEMVASNEAAWSASKAWVKRKGGQNSDLDLHAASWLHYGYLQQGRFARARALSDSLAAMFPPTASDSAPHHVQMYLEAVALQNAVEAAQWDSAAPDRPATLPLTRFRVAASALHRGDRATLAQELARLRHQIDSIGRAGGKVRARLRSTERVLTALNAQANGRDHEAVAALGESATID